MTARKRIAVFCTLVGTLVLAAHALAFQTVYPVGVTIHEPGVAEGYVLFGAQDGTVYLVGVDGTVVHTWAVPCGWEGSQQALANGHVLVGSCGMIRELAWDGTVVWELAPPPGVEFHDDRERLSNGNTLILCRRTISEPAISSEDIVEDFILEVSPEGEVVWEWYEADHFGEFGFPQERLDLIDTRGGDWSHAVSVSSIPDNTSHADSRFAPGNVIIGLRNQNTLAIIDRPTGQIVWVLTDALIGPHGAHMITDDLPGGGNLLVLDNGYGLDWSVVPNRDHSIATEVNPTNNSFPYTYRDSDSVLARGAFFNPLDGGVQRLANGNTLIAEANFGRIFEVTVGGQIVWEYIIPIRNPVDRHNGTFRASKVPLDWAEPHFVPDLVASGEGTPDPVPAGSDLGYALRVENTGPDAAIDVQLTTAIPDDATFQSVSAPAGWGCSAPPVGGTGPVSCTGPALGAGSSSVVALVVRVTPCLEAETTISLTATATSSGNEADPADNSITIDATTVSGAALIEDLAAGLVNDAQDVELSWDDVAPGCGYRVLRSTTSDGGFIDISGPLLDTTFVDDGAGTSPVSYYYLID